ncbi:hypothetical protein sscle_08g067220 [Sclerotinia sclerotiorum 1980 UF-70]|uniref:Uncharacterized protein n=1 Tax=Sclerotinia sclerotiorum (strain ATCC 18683 / 1980 / Ss-1) TaxID=665079 RepID=A0A1D9QB29_SCLS1|nr:hypothetical protein sscle_08g067220 [Sclerotinia sclerotiorum 1980 UF-70]
MSWITKNWIARYLKPGHKFKIGNNIWELSGNPINEAEYEDFSRAVYECKLVDERGGEEIKSPAVVKIWMQTPEINTYEDWFYASELYDLYLAENLDTAGDPDIDIASHMGSPEQFVSAGNSDIASDSNFAGHSNPADKSDSDGHSDITNHPNSNTHSNSTYNSDINSATHPIPALNSQSPSNSNSNSNPNPNTTNLINPPNYPEPWDSELTCLNLLNKSYTTLHHTPNIPNTTNTSAQEKSKIPSDTYKPFPYAIGLAKYKQRRNFPLEGGYLNIPKTRNRKPRQSNEEFIVRSGEW